MRISGRLIFRVVLVVGAAVVLWVRLMPRHPARVAQPGVVRHAKGSPGSVPDLSVTHPLNQPGGGLAPAEAYAVYSALYEVPAGEPLVFAADSGTDIPQVGGSCLRPKTQNERAMADAFAAANQQSHTWEQKFSISPGYRLLGGDEVGQALSCLHTHGQDVARCASYKDVRHVRFLGVPGFDAGHTHALVSVIKKCGEFCGSGGIFEVEKKGGTWQRVDVSDFTRDCSWAY